MDYFPDFSDLADVGNETLSSWEGEIAVRAKYRRYFDGSVFREKVPLDVSIDDDAPELYPVGINLVKMLSIAQADSLFGEWDEDIVKFEPRQDVEVKQPEKDAADLSSKILRSSNANSVLWEVALDREIYGGGVLKIGPALHLPGYVRWSHIALDSFFPIYDPDDPDEILEAYIITPMLRDQARAKYGYDGDKDIVQRVEHWTRGYYTNELDGVRIDAYSGLNPWGFVPLVFIPRMRSTHWWGDALTEDLIRPQDDLNMRLADLSESVWYNAHPIRWGKNLPKGFNSKNYPVGANVLWDLGRWMKDAPEPEVGILESKNPIPQGVFDYINFIYDWTRTSSFAPPIAFGEDNGGGQRSGITLEIRMWPLVKATRRSRAYMEAGLRRAMKMSAQIIQQKLPLEGVSVRALERLIRGDMVPRFAPLMPRDQAQIVDMVVKLLATNPKSISLETAVKLLGLGTAEVEKIKEMLADDDLFARQEMQYGADEPAGMNSGSGNAPK